MKTETKIPEFEAKIEGVHLTFTCPQCGRKNLHGRGAPDNIAYGHRLSHCQCWEHGYYLIPSRPSEDSLIDQDRILNRGNWKPRRRLKPNRSPQQPDFLKINSDKNHPRR